MNVLITGYPGWLCNRLVERSIKETDWNIRCLMLYNTEGLFDNQLQGIYRGDITDPWNLEETTRDIDLVIHAAGIIHGRPNKLMEVNGKGTYNMLKSAEHNHVKKFIYISSNSVGGFTKEKLLMNEDTHINPYMAYGRSKALAESHVASFSNDIPSIILRPCRYYGLYPPDRDIKMFKLIKSGKGIVMGDGEDLRSMTYTDNLIDAIFLAAKHNVSNLETYWIADENPYTNNEILETMADIMNVEDFKIFHIPKLISKTCRGLDRIIQFFKLYSMIIHVAGELSLNIACSIDKAKKELGYTPRVSLYEGMNREIQWCKERNLI